MKRREKKTEDRNGRVETEGRGRGGGEEDEEKKKVLGKDINYEEKRRKHEGMHVLMSNWNRGTGKHEEKDQRKLMKMEDER